VSQKQPSQVVSANADELTLEQVGEGWRLAKHDEEPHWRAQVWWKRRKEWRPRPNDMVGKPYEPSSTYRVPVECLQ